jgi:hypothetical protein
MTGLLGQEPEQNCLDRTARIRRRKLGQNRKEKIARKDRHASQLEQTVKIGQAEQDCQDRAAKIRQSKQDKKERTAGQNIQDRASRQDRQNGTASTTLPRQYC